MKFLEDHYKFVLIFLAYVLLFLHLTSVIHKSVTYDEGGHLNYGANILKGDADRTSLGIAGNSKMPVTALNAIPFAIIQSIENPPAFVRNLLNIRVARFVTILMSILFGTIVFVWSRELYGTLAGLFSFFLYVFSPSILAHGQLITTDVYVMGFSTLALYTYWKFLKSPSWTSLITSGISFGLAQISKYSALYLIPIYVLLFILHKPKNWHRSSRVIQRVWPFILCLLTMFVINTAFLFDRVFLPFKEGEYQSELFLETQKKLGLLGNLPPLLAFPYLEGLDRVRHDERNMETFGNIYLLGELRAGPFPSYYFVTVLFKEPIPVLIFLAITIFAGIKKRRNFAWRTNEFFLILPVAVMMIVFSFFFRAQIGIRYLLIIYPLVYVWMGSLLREPAKLSRNSKMLGMLLLAYLVGSTLSYHPHYLSYVNEFIIDRKMAYRILADSNIDWGQSDWYLDQYRIQHPEIHIQPDHPMSGTIVVDVNRLVGVVGGKNRYAWLRDHYTPTGHIAYSYLIFEVPEGSLSQ